MRSSARTKGGPAVRAHLFLALLLSCFAPLPAASIPYVHSSYQLSVISHQVSVITPAHPYTSTHLHPHTHAPPQFFTGSPTHPHTHTVLTGSPTHPNTPYRLLQPGSPVKAVTFSPGGSYLATAGEDGLVRLWDPRSGICRRILGSPNTDVDALAFSPDGRRLYTTQNPYYLNVWDPRNGTKTASFTLPQRAPIYALACSPDGKGLAVSTGPWIWLLDSTSGSLLHTIDTSNDHYSTLSLAYSPDGRFLASAGEDGRVRLRDPHTGKELSCIGIHRAAATGVAFSRNGRLASVGRDHQVKVDGREIGWHEGEAWSAAFSPDGKLLATGGQDGIVRFWDPVSGQQEAILRGQGGNIKALAFSTDGRFLASGSNSGSGRLWDFPSLYRQVKQAALEGRIYGERPQIRLHLGHIGQVESLEFSPDGSTIATGGADRTIQLWDVRTGQPLRSLEGYSGIVSAHFLPGGRTLAGACEEASIKLWDLQAGRLLWTIDNGGWPIAFSPDGSLVASGQGLAKTFHIRNLRTGKELQVLKGHNGTVDCVAFSPDGKLIASGSNDSTARLWEVSTGKLIYTLGPPPGTNLQETLQGIWWRMGNRVDTVNRIAFSPDGKTLVCSHRWGAVQVWDTRTGKLIRSLPHPQLTARSLAFSPDGAILASAYDSGTVNLWDTRSWSLTYTLFVPHVGPLAFSPNSAIFAAGSENDIRLYQLHIPIPVTSYQLPVTRRPHPHPYQLSVISHQLSDAYAPTPTHLDSHLPIDPFTHRHPLTPTHPHTRTGLRIGLGLRLRIPSHPHTLTPTHPFILTPLQRWGQTNGNFCLVLFPDGKTLAVGSGDGAIQLWDTANGSLEKTLLGCQAEVFSLSCSRDGSLLAAASRDGTVKLWDRQKGRLLWTAPFQDSPPTSVTLSGDGKLLIVGDEAGHLHFWDLLSRMLLHTWDLSNHELEGKLEEWTLGRNPLAHSASAVLSPDGQSLAVWWGMDAFLYDPRTGQLKQDLHPHGWAWSPTFSPDSKTVAMGVSQGYTTWDVRTGQWLTSWPGPDPALSVALAPDGKSLAAGDTKGAITLYDPGPHLQLLGHTSEITGLAYSPDGRRLFSSSRDGALRVWDPASGRLLVTLLALSMDRGWFAVTPEGYFDCSVDAAHYVTWKISNRLYPVERYLRRFRRPDLVRKALRGETLEAPEITTEDVPPTVHFTHLKYNGESLVTVTLETSSRRPIKEVHLLVNGRPLPPRFSRPVSTTSYSIPTGSRPLEVSSKPLEVSSKPLEVSSKPIEVSSKPIEVVSKSVEVAARPIKLTSKPLEVSSKPYGPGSKEGAVGMMQEFSFVVPLPLGASDIHIRAVAYDSQDLGSTPAELFLQRQSARRIPGNLYVLCVGISHYHHGRDQSAAASDPVPMTSNPYTPTPTHPHSSSPPVHLNTPTPPLPIPNLRFPAPDARAMAARFRQERLPLYRRVEVHTLLDGQVTPESLRKEFQWLQKSVRPGQVDTVIVFLSGHGISDREGHYFFPTCLFDRNTLASTSLSGQDLQAELGSKLQARDVFLFVDTCHSGAIPGARAEDLDFEVRENGVYMMASSEAGQYSYESPRWGHGAFTLALLRSLHRKELARDGIIHFNALAAAVPEELARLMREAGQNQASEQPVIPLENRSLLEPVARPQ